MDEEGVGQILAKATDLRLKISNCIQKGNDPLPNNENGDQVDGEEGNGEEDEEAQRLFNICDALEALENQLSALQNLQQQQRYERELTLAEIENNRKKLLNKLKEYKGKELEVIREASAFADETVYQSNDLLLPPYPTRSPHSFALQNGYFPPTHKPRNGVITNEATNGGKKDLSDTDRPRNSKGLGPFLCTAAKTVVTLIGMVSVLSLSGFGPKLVRSNTSFNIFGHSKQPPSEERRSAIQCPPGKVLVLEDGKSRCVVKERVEVPFSSVVARPDVNYGCG